jgi:hypothetical protein
VLRAVLARTVPLSAEWDAVGELAVCVEEDLEVVDAVILG